MESENIMAGVRIKERWVPFPRSISSQAKAALEQMVDANGNAAFASTFPASDDLAGWAAMSRQTDGFVTQFLTTQLGENSPPVETVVMNGAKVHVARPEHADGKHAYLDIHGGGFIAGGGMPCQLGARLIARQHGIWCYGVDYRMPPEHPYPAALDDCLAVYRKMLELHAARNIVVGGGSAGGNLAAALMLRARDEGLPLPAGVLLMTPEVDLTESGDSFQTNQFVDVLLPRPIMEANLLYAAGHDLKHPYLSPLFGDFTRGFPPTFLQSGTRDLFLSNTVQMHRALRRANISVELHIFEGMPHGGFMGAPEDAELKSEVTRFVAAHLGA